MARLIGYRYKLVGGGTEVILLDVLSFENGILGVRCEIYIALFEVYIIAYYSVVRTPGSG